MTDGNIIDWNAFWAEAEGDRRRSANVGQYEKSDLMERFFGRVGVPKTVASFGCGPAAILRSLADRYPDTQFYGYDTAYTIIEENRERVRREGIENVHFEVERLPTITTDRRFDLVYCYATLHYVRDAERALAALYDRVAEGGHLVCNYPNTLSHSRMHEEFSNDEAMRERFALVFDGENLLSYRRIRDVLGTEPRSYWSAVDAPDEEWTGRGNPCIFVPK